LDSVAHIVLDNPGGPGAGTRVLKQERKPNHATKSDSHEKRRRQNKTARSFMGNPPYITPDRTTFPNIIRPGSTDSLVTPPGRARLSTVVLLALFIAGFAAAQSVHPLTGRKIAPTMGVGGADWLERSERESEEHPDDALDALNIKPGVVVADVGAGVGYITTRLAKRVGPTGKVYATDIQPEMLSRLQERLNNEHITNVEPVLSSQADPKLPAGKIDLILMVDVYHELTQPQRMLRKMREALKPDGRLVLIEYRKEDPTIPIRPEHKMSVVEVKTEVEAEGYRLADVLRNLPRQNIFIFVPLRTM
jgi:SAM-dependent methyltransferase